MKIKEALIYETRISQVQKERAKSPFTEKDLKENQDIVFLSNCLNVGSDYIEFGTLGKVLSSKLDKSGKVMVLFKKEEINKNLELEYKASNDIKCLVDLKDIYPTPVQGKIKTLGNFSIYCSKLLAISPVFVGYAILMSMLKLKMLAADKIGKMFKK